MLQADFYNEALEFAKSTLPRGKKILMKICVAFLNPLPEMGESGDVSNDNSHRAWVGFRKCGIVEHQE